MKNVKDQEFLDLDTDRLDEEWIRQPKLYHNFAVNLAEAKRDLDFAKSRLDIVTAELQRDIGLNPVKYGLGKATVAAIEATVALQQEHQDATKDVTEAKFVVGVLQAGVDGLEHKKRALECLVQLQNADYFSSPRPPKGENGRTTRDYLSEVEKADARSRGKEKRRRK